MVLDAAADPALSEHAKALEVVVVVNPVASQAVNVEEQVVVQLTVLLAPLEVKGHAIRQLLAVCDDLQDELELEELLVESVVEEVVSSSLSSSKDFCKLLRSDNSDITVSIIGGVVPISSERVLNVCTTQVAALKISRIISAVTEQGLGSDDGPIEFEKLYITITSAREQEINVCVIYLSFRL